MEDLIFSTLVGIMTTVGMCLVMYQPKPKAVTTTIKTETVTIAPTVISSPVIDEAVECDLWDTTSESEVAIAIAIDEPVAEIAEPITVVEPVAVVNEPIKADEIVEIDEPIETTTLTLVNNEIEIDKLPLTICKKIAGKLTKQFPDMKISQTVNGTNKPVSQLRSEIKNRVAKEPEMVMAVIEDVLASESKPNSKTSTKKPAKTRSLKAVS